jgi:hypothetical protein
MRTLLMIPDRSMMSMSSRPMSSSCCSHRFDQAGPGRTVNVPFHVVARSIAAHERPAELDRPVVRVERDAFDEQRRSAASLLEKASLSSPEEDGLESLAGANDLRGVAPQQ